MTLDDGTELPADVVLAAVGVRPASRLARAAGRPHRAIHTHPANHAGYYPGAEGMTLELLVDPEGDAILGAQGVGGTGVDKRIDVLATAITGGIAAADPAELEPAYSPPYGSAKDPVNMLGCIDRNHRDGLVETVQWHELDDRLASGATLLDVRTPGEHTAMPIPGGINTELDQLRDRLDELPEGELVVRCQAGLRGYLAARVLAQHGRDVVNLDGGYLTWAARPDGAAATPSGDDEDRGSPAG